MFKIFENIIKLIFPCKCILCGKIVDEKDSLCKDCWEKIRFIEKPYCSKCCAPLEFKISDDDLCANCLKNEPLYIKSRSALIYNHYVAKILFKFKFYDQVQLKYFLAKNMVNHSKDIIDKIDIFIPVPLHKKRLKFRKYNQSLLLANEIAKITNKKVLHNFLFKNENTKPQVTLKQKDRTKNLKNKFSINSKYLNNIKDFQNLNFAIVDDVMTTGSTINECTKELNKNGIKNVYAITFAKTRL